MSNFAATLIWDALENPPPLVTPGSLTQGYPIYITCCANSSPYPFHPHITMLLKFFRIFITLHLLKLLFILSAIVAFGLSIAVLFDHNSANSGILTLFVYTSLP